MKTKEKRKQKPPAPPSIERMRELLRELPQRRVQKSVMFDADVELLLMARCQSTTEKYSDVINEALRHYLTGQCPDTAA